MTSTYDIPNSVRVDRSDLTRVLGLAADIEDRTVAEQRSLLALAEALPDQAMVEALTWSWVPGDQRGVCASCDQPAGGPEWLASGLCEDCG